jgi:hypothetical protein
MESGCLEVAGEVWVDCEGWEESWAADDLLPWLLKGEEPEVVLEAVGVMGEDVSLMGDVGESRSREPVESFVRFFLRNPRVGIRAAVGGMLPSPGSARPGAARALFSSRERTRNAAAGTMGAQRGGREQLERAVAARGA